MTNQTFYSRVDIWFAASICGSLAWCAYLGWSLRAEEPVGAGIAVFIGISMAFVFAYGIIPCKYTLGNDGLNIQLGRTKQSIAYLDIVKWTAETSFASGPMLSFRGVRIKFRGGEVYVSPCRREEFMAELHRHVDLAKSGLVASR